MTSSARSGWHSRGRNRDNRRNWCSRLPQDAFPSHRLAGTGCSHCIGKSCRTSSPRQGERPPTCCLWDTRIGTRDWPQEVRPQEPYQMMLRMSQKVPECSKVRTTDREEFPRADGNVGSGLLQEKEDSGRKKHRKCSPNGERRVRELRTRNLTGATLPRIWLTSPPGHTHPQKASEQHGGNGSRTRTPEQAYQSAFAGQDGTVPGS